MERVVKSLIIMLVLLVNVNPAHAFISEWNNSYTNDNSTNISIPVNTVVTFNVSLNQSSNVTWYLNNSPVLSEENVTGSNFTYNFSAEGGYGVNASSEANNISWSVDVYAPLNVTAYYNNITDSNSTDFEVEHGKSVMFHANRSGTVLTEFWIVNGRTSSNNSTLMFSPEKYGHYNISYTVYGKDRNLTINWTVKVYLEVTDALNTTIRFYKDPERIVSLAPSNTEILFSVGMGGRIVGVDDYSDNPPEIVNMSIVRVGGPYSGISAEVIVNETPDLVVATEINPIATIDLLKSLNITVMTIESRTVNEIMDNLLLLGKIGNRPDTALELVTNLSSRIESVTDFAEGLDTKRKPRLFYVVWYPELWTPGKNTYAHDLMEMAGGWNAAGDGDGWFMMNKEALLAADPDVIVCSGMGGYGATVCNQLKNDTALSTLGAIQNNRMYVVPDSNLIERAGPRIVDGLEIFYEIVKDNLKPVDVPSGGGGGPSIPVGAVEEPDENAGFRWKIQEYEDVKDDILEKLEQKIFYDIGRSRAVAAPMLLLSRFPLIEGVEKIADRFEEDIYEYSAEVAVFKYFFAREVIVARGELEVDSIAALSLAKKKSIPILLTKTAEFPEAALEALGKIKPRKIIIIGGEEAVAPEVEAELSDHRIVERIGGETRVETSIEIAKRTNPEKVILTSYHSNPEAAVASYLYDAPIIYVSPEKLEIIQGFLKTYNPKILFIEVDESLMKKIEEGM